MKKLFKKVTAIATLTMSLVAANSAQANEAKVVFSYNQYEMIMGASLTVNVLDDGHFYAKTTGYSNGSDNVIFEGYFARLSEQDTQEILKRIATVKPGMKIRELTAKEKSEQEHCVMEGGYSFYVIGEQFAGGRKQVNTTYRCLELGLDESTREGRNAVRNVNSLIAMVRDAVSAQSDRIFGRK